MSPLLALAEYERNWDAAALSPTIGWLMLACVLCCALMFTMHADKWRRWWLTAEDPRGIAVFRIVFTFFVICNINGMWEFFEYLFTDEGIFTTDAARQMYAGRQFAGYGDGLRPEDPEGFYDAAAWWQFLRGPKYSLLYFWDSPTAFWIHLWAFEISAVMLMIGFRTRLFGILTWFLMNSILVRNHIAWEGTEVVFRCMLVYLVLARSGHAYSVDNWLRCRKLRKQGLLSQRDGPGGGAGTPPSEAHPEGLAPIYRLIPSWPRKLIMLQLATIYLTTGTLKTGGVWMQGDALYYALNLDHFYRLPPQYLSSVVGTTAFRGMTWAVKIGQTSFALIIFGLVARFVMAEKFPPLSRLRRGLGQLCFAGMIACTAAIIYVAYPVHVTPKIPRQAFTALWVGGWVGLWLLWIELGRSRLVIRKLFGHELARPCTIDRAWVCRWVFGRRVLLVWHLAFHAHIFTLMNVGQFQTGMMACTFAFLEGREIATLLRDIGYRLSTVFPARIGRLMPAAVRERLPIIPAADPTLPSQHREPRVLPDWGLGLAFAGIVAGVLVRVGLEPSWDFRLIWVGTAAAVVLGAAWQRWRTREHTTLDDQLGRAPWAYGPLGRVVIGGLIIWHLGAVATWLMPNKEVLSSFRPEARKAVGHYLAVTTTSQGWGMFAPNPPRHNVFMKVLVTDAEGEIWDMRTDVYAAEKKPIPWIWNTRERKMNRRIIGGEPGPKSYRKWYARWMCRQWAREHEGVAPYEVELIKMSYRTPKPEQVREQGYYIAEQRLAEHGREEVSYTARCARETMGQLPDFIRARDGLPLLEDGEYRPWHKQRRKKWDAREERAATRAKKDAARAQKDAQRIKEARTR